jgi:hypothetical protein
MATAMGRVAPALEERERERAKERERESEREREREKEREEREREKDREESERERERGREKDECNLSMYLSIFSVCLPESDKHSEHYEVPVFFGRPYKHSRDCGQEGATPQYQGPGK